MGRLMGRISKSEEKWRISAASFANEHAFCAAVRGQQQQLLGAGVHIPTVFHAEAVPPPSGSNRTEAALQFARGSSGDGPGTTKLLPAVSSLGCSSTAALALQFDFLFEFLDPASFSQTGQLDREEARAALQLLASFHTYFWLPNPDPSGGGGGEDPHVALRQALFRRGGWWRKELRPSVQYGRIPEAFRGLCRAFPEPELMGGLDTTEAHGLMERLAGR